MSLILGIESSCDETSAAVVADGRRVLANLVGSQVALHAKYRGVVPEIAARAHVQQVVPMIEAALSEARIQYHDLDAIAVTAGPGLAGALLIGVTAARTLALTLDKPLVAVDHIEAHAVSAALADDPPAWPAIALVVSGGHTALYLVRDFLDIELLGQTRDDAAGEAFDKVAAILELGFPGGPAIDRLARHGDPARIAFPRTWIEAEHLDFSFSGLKTAVLYHVHGVGRKYAADDAPRRDLADVAASFQAALVETLVARTMTAVRRTAAQRVVVGGGVGANSALRIQLARACDAAGVRLHLTPAQFCTDNAAMIASLGQRLLDAGRVATLDLEPWSGLRRPPAVRPVQ